MYLTRFVKYLRQPSLQHLIIHVTNRCNFRCRHCFVDSSTPHDLSLERCRTLAAEVGSLFWLDIGGGEPFLREDLPEIVSAFTANVVMIPTNGSLADTAVEQLRAMRKLTSANLGVSLSLDGHQPTHDRMRKPGSWEAVWTCYEKLRKLQGVSVKINTVLSSENIDEMLDLMRLVRKQGPDFHSVILLRGTPHDKAVGLPSMDRLRKVVPEILEIQGEYDYGRTPITSALLRNYHRYMWHVSLATINRRAQVVPCLAGKAHAVIQADGSVSSCEMLGPVGNIDNDSWGNIARGTKLQEQVKSIENMECFCTHNCALLSSIFFNPRTAARLLFPVRT